MADEQVRELGTRGFEVDVIDTSGGVTNLPAWNIRANRLAGFRSRCCRQHDPRSLRRRNRGSQGIAFLRSACVI